MRITLRFSGILTAAIYVIIAVLSSRFSDAIAPSVRPILGILSLLAIACLLYLASVALIAWAARRPRESTVAGPNAYRGIFRDVLLFSVLFRLTLLFSIPIQEVDFYRYLWDGRVLWQGLNPYRFSPEQIDSAGVNTPIELSEFAALRDESGPMKEIFSRVHHRQVPTIYPPLAQVFFAVCAAITPVAAPIWLHLLVLRILLILVDVGILYSMRGLLRQVGMSDAWCLAYGWCPLAIKEVANSAHIDGLAVLFTLIMLQLLLKAARVLSLGQRSQLPWTMAGGCLGLAILSKSYPIILLPLMASFGFAKIGVRALVPIVVCAAVVTAGYLPFLNLPTMSGVAAGSSSIASPPVDGHSPWKGLGTYLTQWQMNDLLFMVVHENLRVPLEDTNRWFVVVPIECRREINRPVASSLARWGFTANVDPAFVATQLVMGTVLIGLLAWCAWQVFRKPEPLVLLRSAFLVLAWGWLLSSAQNPWYVLWFLPVMPFARCRSWFFVPCLALVYYLRFWLVFQGDWTATTGECPEFDYGWVWFEHGLVLGALAIESWMHRRHARDASHSGVSGGGVSSGLAASFPAVFDG